MARRLYVIGIAQAIYGLSIAREKINEIVLVHFGGFEGVSGARDYDETKAHLSEICNVLKLDFVTMSITEIRESNTREEYPFVDIGVLTRLGSTKSFVRPIVLACQVEHVNIMRPSLLKGFSYSLVKRVDLLRKIIWPLRIKEFYTLAPTPKKGFLLKERTINRAKLESIRREIVRGLQAKNQYTWLKGVPFNDNRKVVIVLPFAKHFGGSERVNTKIFEVALQVAKTFDIDTILIKNHPSDPTQYGAVFGSIRSEGMEVYVLRDKKERSFPLELLTALFSGHLFVGAESTVMITSDSTQISKPFIVEEINRRSKRHRDYDIGAIKDLYDAERYFV